MSPQLVRRFVQRADLANIVFLNVLAFQDWIRRQETTYGIWSTLFLQISGQPSLRRT
jgi:hypothetical protein